MSLSPADVYALTGCGLFILGLHALFARAHLLRKIMAANIAGGGVFLVLVATAYRAPDPAPDPVPHAMVLTGIVVAVCGTALAIVLAERVQAATGGSDLEEPPPPDGSKQDGA